jgi:hypothetical protein
MVFSCVPIPFAKNGGFNFQASKFGQFLSSIKSSIDRGVDAVKDFFSQNFINPIRDGVRDKLLSPLDRDISSPLNDINEFLDKYTANNYAGLEASIPELFSKTDSSVVSARNNLLNCLGKVNTNTDNYKVGPFMLGELINMAESSDSLAKAIREYEQHTDNLSGLGGAGSALELQRLYGNVSYSGANVNIASSVVVSPNLSSSRYPIVDIGDTIVVSSEQKIVVDKTFTATSGGAAANVSVDVLTDNVKIITANVATLNLANSLLETSGTLTLNTNMYISVNGEVRQVNTINTLGDYLTVYYPFYNSAVAQTLYKETSFNVNSAFSTTSTNQELKVRKSLVCNSICLDNVITGNGTSFTSDLVANNKILYDSREYIVVSVTDTTIVVDDYVRAANNFAVYKVTNETPFVGLDEDLVDPDGIVNAFTLPGSITGDPTYMDGMVTRVRRANGIYQTVSASKPTDAAQALFQDELMRRTREILNQMRYDLRNDAVRSLSNADTVLAITNITNQLTNARDDVRNIVEQDIAVLNQAKNLVKGMVKLFSLSCSKKKRKDTGANDSDEYLDIILYPNPQRQGCNATTSDFIVILDDFDQEYNDPGFNNNDVTANTTIPNFGELDELDGVDGPFPRQTTGTGTGEADTGVDNNDPDVNVPEDPCAKPC